MFENAWKAMFFVSVQFAFALQNAAKIPVSGKYSCMHAISEDCSGFRPQRLINPRWLELLILITTQGPINGLQVILTLTQLPSVAMQ